MNDERVLMGEKSVTEVVEDWISSCRSESTKSYWAPQKDLQLL